MTAIEWTDRVWNPVRGCARVSPGCENCYAERQAHRFAGEGQPYAGLTVLGKHGPRWAGRARFEPSMLGKPLEWRKPQRVFVNSMSDLFHSDVSNEQIAAVFGVMAACPQHTFQVLTKRPERMRQWFRWLSEKALAYRCDRIEVIAGSAAVSLGVPSEDFLYYHGAEGARVPLPNVWLGVSCEDQKHADQRIPLLLECPAAVRFVSAEPLLGPIKMLPSWAAGFDYSGGRKVSAPRVDWWIVGGESGPGARPCDVKWIRSVVKQCADSRVPCFVKQLGAKPAWSNRFGTFVCGRVGATYLHLDGLARGALRDRKGGDLAEWPEDLRVRQVPEARS